MDGGQLTLCLRCRDLAASRQFYETLGLEVVEESDISLVLKNGHTRLALMTFLESNCLNFRGADPFLLQETFTSAGITTDTLPESYKAAKYSARADGACWSIVDPDGNNVFIDTNEAETSATGKHERIADLLNATLQDLENLEADEACIAAFRKQVLEKFTKG